MSSPSVTIRVWICQTAIKHAGVAARLVAAAVAAARPVAAAVAAPRPVAAAVAATRLAVAAVAAGCEAVRPPHLHLRSFPTSAS